MASKRSYEIKFGINDSEVSQQLSNIDKSLTKTQSEAKLLKTSLSAGWDTDKWVQSKQTAQKAVEDTAKKVELLRKRLAEMQADGTAESKAEQFESLKREILASENAAKKAVQELKKIDNLRLDAIKQQLTDVSERLTNIGKTMSIAVTAPIVAAGAASVSAYSSMFESMNKVETVFGSASGSVESFADKTLQAYGIAKSTSLDMAAGFGDMATSMGLSESEAADMSKTLVGLAGDLASFKNMSLDEVKTSLNSIFTGEAESAKRIGAVMTEANLQEYALAAGIKKRVSEMSQAEKVQLRYQFILSKTTNSQGDFSKTSESTANQLRLLQESVKELAAVAGEELAPMVTPIIKSLNSLIGSIGNLDDDTKGMITRVAVFAAAFGPLVAVTGKLTGGVVALIGVYQKYKAASDAAKVAQVGLNAAQSASPAGAIATVVGIAAAALGSYAITAALTSEKNKTLSQTVKEAGDAYDDAAESINKTRSDSLSELSVLEDTVKRYDELNGKIDKTSDEKSELASIVETINGKLGTSISMLDGESGQYDTSTQAIRDNIQARKDLINAEAAEDLAVEAKKQMLALQSANGGLTVEQAKSKIASTQEWIAGLGLDVMDFGKTADWLDNKVFGAGAANKEIKELQEYIAAYQKLESEYNKYISGMNTNAGGSGAETPPSAPSVDLKAVEYQYQMGQISVQKYIASLQQYRDAIDKTTESGLSEWRSASLKIKQLQDSIASDNQTAAEKAAAERERVAEEEVASIKAAAEAAAEALRSKIAKERTLTDYSYKVGEISLKQYMWKLEDIRDAYYKEDSDEYRAYTLELLSLQQEYAEKCQAAAKENESAHKALYEYQYQMGEMNLAEYIKRIALLRSAFTDEDTKEYRDYTLQIKSLQDELAEQERQAAEDRVSTAKEATDEICSMAQEEADARIAAIDAELAARKKLQESETAEIRLQQAKAQLAFTRDEDSRASLQREIAAMQADIDEAQYQQTASEQKAAIQSEVESLKSSVAEMVAAMQGTTSKAAQNEFVQKYVAPQITVNANGLTELQAKRMVEQVYNDIMYGV